MLEDDNWWQPDFLERMLEAMATYPNVKVAWANMRVWKENSDEEWVDTGQNIWNCESTSPRLINWPNRRQMLGAFHSNGAMLVRSEYASQYAIPESLKFGGTEAIRERAFHFPILFIPQVLANFSTTIITSRPKNSLDYGIKQILLAASYIKYVPIKEDDLNVLWQEARAKPAKSTMTLFFAALKFPECRKLLRHAAIRDWIFFAAFSLKHLSLTWLTLRALSSNYELWNFLDRNTALRAKESQSTAIKHSKSK